MKPRNKKHIEIMRLSGELSPLTSTQTNWAFRHALKHYGYRLKNGKCTYMDCGHEWTEERNSIVRCPKCGAVLELKDTKERVLRQKAYFNVITTKGNYQVIRMFLTISEMRKGYKANPAYLEVGQYWIFSLSVEQLKGDPREEEPLSDCNAKRLVIGWIVSVSAHHSRLETTTRPSTTAFANTPSRLKASSKPTPPSPQSVRPHKSYHIISE